MDRPDPVSYWGRLAARLDLGSPEHMVLLDVGMVAELTREDQANLVQFFKVRLRPLLCGCCAVAAQRGPSTCGVPLVSALNLVQGVHHIP